MRQSLFFPVMSSYLSEWNYTKVLRELYEDVDIVIVGDSHVRRFKDFTSSRFHQEIGFTPDLKIRHQLLFYYHLNLR